MINSIQNKERYINSLQIIYDKIIKSLYDKQTHEISFEFIEQEVLLLMIDYLRRILLLEKEVSNLYYQSEREHNNE
jgi:hypothetical protein